MKKIFPISFFLFIYFSVNGFCGFWDKKPENYNECITKNMKGITSDLAARQIVRACREMFPEPKLPPQLLQKELMGNIPCRADYLTYNSELEGFIYNNIKYFHITKIKVFVKTYENDQIVARDYWKNIDIPPLSNADFRIPIWPIQGKNFRWGLHEVYGHPVAP